MCSDKHAERPPKGINWADLQPMSTADTLREIALPLPWLIVSLACFASPYWLLGFPASFMFFLCALRLNHEAIHSNLGLSRHSDSLVMHGLSFLMLGSNHAFAHGHLVHHKHAMGPGDFEGKCGEMSLSQVLIYGPRFGFDVFCAAWAGARPKRRRKMVVDLALNAVMLALALGFGGALALHAVAMLIAQCLTALFAVWLTHRGASGKGVAARSQRGVLARLAYLMFYHREHHLYPKVPVSRLPELALRLDRDVPGYAVKRLPVLGWLERKGTAAENEYAKL